MSAFIRRLILRFKNIIQYGLFSVASTVVDTIAVWLLFNGAGMELVYANTIGIILGFILDFFLSSKFVFNTKYGLRSFLIYLGTFIFGLLLANFLITTSYDFASLYFSEGPAFLISKAVSIVLPFFLLYFVRKGLYNLLNRRYKEHE